MLLPVIRATRRCAVSQQGHPSAPQAGRACASPKPHWKESCQELATQRDLSNAGLRRVPHWEDRER